VQCIIEVDADMNKLFLEEERERELEELYDANLADNLNREDGEQPEADSVQKQTSETLMAGEKIMEALELADADRAAIKEWQAAGADPGAQPSRNPELLARGNLAADEYVLQVLQKIPAAGMEDALLVLPFQQVVSLLEYLDEWARAVSYCTAEDKLTISLATSLSRRASCFSCSEHTITKLSLTESCVLLL
jgi:hypothetical protein